MKLLELLSNLLRSAAGPLLTDDNVWEMVQVRRCARCSDVLCLGVVVGLVDAFV